MRTIQMTLDEDLIKQVDRVVRRLKTTRSAFTRRALRAALAHVAAEEQEARHRRGYKRTPVKPGEFADWSREQVWPE